MTYRSARSYPGGDDRRDLPGPFAIIGDVHGCAYTLDSLLSQLGGSLEVPPPALTLVSLGDLHDKGGRVGVRSGCPSASGSVRVLRWALRMRDAGRLLLVDSNHGHTLVSLLRRGVEPDPESVTRPTEVTIADLQAQLDAGELIPAVERLLSAAPPFLRLSGGPSGELIVAHAAAAPRLLDSARISHSEYQYHLRAPSFRWTGSQTVVVGHEPVPHPSRERERLPGGTYAGEVVRIDTGAYRRAGSLTAYLPHEDRFVAVPADRRDWQGLTFTPTAAGV